MRDWEYNINVSARHDIIRALSVFARIIIIAEYMQYFDAVATRVIEIYFCNMLIRARVTSARYLAGRR